MMIFARSREELERIHLIPAEARWVYCYRRALQRQNSVLAQKWWPWVKDLVSQPFGVL